MVNLFLVHTPFQLLVSELMLTGIPSLARESNYLLVNTSIPLTVNSGLWTKVQYVDPPVGTLFAGETISHCRTTVQRVVAQFSGRPVMLMLSNLDYPLANAFFRLVQVQPEQFKLGIFPEGMLNYMTPELSWKKRFKNRAKQVVGAYYGWPFASYGKDVAGFFHADRFYGFRRILNMMAVEWSQKGDVEIVEIPTPDVTIEASACDQALLLGQPLYTFIPHSAYVDNIDGMIRFAQQLGARQILYKKHPVEHPEIEGLLQERQVQIVADERPAELYFLDHPAAFVIGPFSSALVHLKLFYEQQVQCYAFADDIDWEAFPNKRSYYDKARQFFEQMDVAWVGLSDVVQPRYPVTG